MTYKLIFTEKAYSDLVNVYNEVLSASKDFKTANKYLKDIMLAIESKLDFPNSTQLVEFNLPKQVRYFTFKAYKVFYFVEDDKVIVINVLLAKSDYAKKILEEFR